MNRIFSRISAAKLRQYTALLLYWYVQAENIFIRHSLWVTHACHVPFNLISLQNKMKATDKRLTVLCKRLVLSERWSIFLRNKEENRERVRGRTGAVRLLWLHSPCKNPVAMEIEYVGTLVAKGPHPHKSLLLKNNDCSGGGRSYFSRSHQYELSQSAKLNA